MPSKESDELRAQFEDIVKRMAADPTMDLGLSRPLLEQLHLRASEPAGVTYHEELVGGRDVLCITPQGCDGDKVLLYLHGGGFTMNSVHSHRKMVAHLAKAAGCAAVLPDYRLAPEHPFPAAIEDCVGAYRWLCEQGFSPSSIAIGGDSAGASLATAVIQILRSEGIDAPGALIGLSPWFDMEGVGATFDTNADKDVLISRPMVMLNAGLYLNGRPAQDALVNPLYADLRGFPPAFLTCGSYEALRSDTERFAERAVASDVDVTVEIADGMQHVYPLMAGRAPEADIVIGRIGSWLRAQLAKDDPEVTA